MIKVAINGYGTIGKRVADAIVLQDDMQLQGVVKTKPSYEAKIAIKNKYPLYANNKENTKAFIDAGIKIEGTIDDLIDKSDIVIDCTPGKFGAQNRQLYRSKKIKAIFQGGEKPEVAQVSFNAQGNYKQAIGKDYVRVVSCNTTGLCRTLGSIHKIFGVKKAIVTLIRRAADPNDSKKGPINAVVPVIEVPSHHGPDVNTIFPDLNILTSAVAVPTTIMHLHTIAIELEKQANASDIKDLFKNTPRVILVDEKDGFVSTAQIMEYARDLGRKRGDLNEIAVWKNSINIVSNQLFFIQAIHQESDVVPENIDCIRAMFELTKDPIKSIRKTNIAMSIQ
ncbi:MAG: type II glyceraldehyde-3-phosphate dehydrogenase [Candidatus Aenigmarchaeota archaeon ex4484_52]|nr:MAG: type II glyceraldehyde-3-phosphate dehydrogenase [Candidatus Aenigmarchaeota archaeon ex4484_52]